MVRGQFLQEVWQTCIHELILVLVFSNRTPSVYSCRVSRFGTLVIFRGPAITTATHERIQMEPT